MRIALVLLLMLAIAAIPGSVFPQRTADPNGVTQWRTDNPDLFPVLDAMHMFDVYTSPWFSAIYLLLFVSLIGCVLPRVRHHAKALRTPPPRTPVRLQRLADYRVESRTVEGDASVAADRAVTLAEQQLRRSGYRVKRYDNARGYSVSAERGYARETGNLVFHLSLVGILITIGVGGGYSYTGQRVMAEGETFVNTLLDYSSMNRGRLVADDSLEPYSMTLNKFDVTYEPFGTVASGQAGNYAAHITVREPDGSSRQETVRVNHPVRIGPDQIYLLGNGYAPTVTVRNTEGTTVFTGPVPFIPQNDSTMESLGVIKIPDGMDQQIGMVGFFYPTQMLLDTGAGTSIFPDLVNPVLTLDVFVGDLGIDDGTPRSVYVLDTTDMTKLTGRGTDVQSIELAPGESADLPNGMGTITFENMAPEGATDYAESVTRYVSLQVHRDGSAVWVLTFALLGTAGLMTALFVPRRRVWVKAAVDGNTVTFEYAGLARGEDPTLATAVNAVADTHGRTLDGEGMILVDPVDPSSEDSVAADASPATPRK